MNSQETNKLCRICFEETTSISRFISPCQCRGTSQYIHIHCLEQWQTICLQGKYPQNASYCSVCHTNFTYPSMFTLFFKRIYILLELIVLNIQKNIDLLLYIMFFLPYRLLLQSLLWITVVPFGQINLNNGEVLAWVGDHFPPQITLLSLPKQRNNPDLQPGTLLIASNKMKEYSSFYQTLILIIQVHPEYGIQGIILNPPNYSYHSLRIRLGFIPMFYGGPMRMEHYGLLHNNSSIYLKKDNSLLSNLQELSSSPVHTASPPRSSIYYTEDDAALDILSQLANEQPIPTMRENHHTSLRSYSTIPNNVRPYVITHEDIRLAYYSFRSMLEHRIPSRNVYINPNYHYFQTTSYSQIISDQSSNVFTWFISWWNNWWFVTNSDDNQPKINHQYLNIPIQSNLQSPETTSSTSKPLYQLRLIQGQCIWLKYQLENEIEQGYWLISKCRDEDVFPLIPKASVDHWKDAFQYYHTQHHSSTSSFSL